MEIQINQATRHGVNVFIYDWYWYDRRPFLEDCLNDGFLKAANTNDMKFYLMWENHDATHLWDCRLAKEYVDIHEGCPLITINSWNERTESSYLQPDNIYGYGYLEAVKRVFVDGE